MRKIAFDFAPISCRSGESDNHRVGAILSPTQDKGTSIVYRGYGFSAGEFAW